MASEKLRQARDYEARHMPGVPETERPAFHVTGGVGWINDPNGFSCYRGEYHLFFQYHPYAVQWGPMHWGHVKSRDFITWERLPVALAPDAACDRDGCFSGSALELPDGRHMLMYTGVLRRPGKDGAMEERQTQCLAFGDGVNYEKYGGNPVITARDLPEDGDPANFRDPKIWRGEDGACYSVVGNRTSDGSGAIRLFESGDCLHWRYAGTIDRSNNECGRMWECPDFFPLDGRQLLLASHQEMEARALEFRAGYGAICLIGDCDLTSRAFTRERVQSIDCGPDFYAPQTLLTPDGRRVMIAWMQNWADTDCPPEGARIFGEMTLPRELRVRDGRLIQNPVRELQRYHGNRVAHEGVRIGGEGSLPGISGRVLDMTVRIRPAGAGYRWFQMNLAKGGEGAVAVRYRPECGTVRVERGRRGAVDVGEFRVWNRGGEIKLRVVMDRHSVELFVNDGEQAATFKVGAPPAEDAITFAADGCALADVEKYDLDFQERNSRDF